MSKIEKASPWWTQYVVAGVGMVLSILVVIASPHMNIFNEAICLVAGLVFFYAIVARATHDLRGEPYVHPTELERHRVNRAIDELERQFM